MNIRNTALFIFAMVVLFSCNKKEEKTTTLNNPIDSVSYCSGVVLGMSMKQAGLDTLNPDVFVKAVLQVIKKDTNLLVDANQANQFLQMYFAKQQQKKFEPNIQAGQKFLEENKKKEGVITTPSGLQYKIISEGKGENPKPTDMVSVLYKGSLIDGKVFDQSEGNNPVSFPLNQVIPGWTEGLQLMKPGAKFEFYISYNFAYGERGYPPRIEPYSTLIFEVELVKAEKAEDAQKNAQKNAPKNAQKK